MNPQPGELAALEERGFVIAGPAVAARAGFAEVAGEHQRQIGGAIGFGGVEPMVDAFALVNGGRLDGGEVLGQLLNQFLRATEVISETVSRS